MIVFDLKCEAEHVFEAWFGSTAAYEDQRGRGLVACPVCGSCTVAKAVMAPRVCAKGNRQDASLPVPRPTSGPAPDAQAVAMPGTGDAARIKAALAALAAAQAKALGQSTWVGDSFADRARAMHYGEEEHRPIHGSTATEEARALIDEGIGVMPLLVPVVPPEAQN